MQALAEAYKGEYEVVIIDSLSHEWQWTLDYHQQLINNSKMNSFSAWNPAKKDHKELIAAILRCPMHIIATARVKQEYALELVNGKQTPKKMGVGLVEEDGLEYEFTSVFELHADHSFTATKDRMNLFDSATFNKFDEKTFNLINNWLNVQADKTEESKSKLEDDLLPDSKPVTKI